MQVTTHVKEEETNWFVNIGLGLGILLCLMLFGLVIARMGLLNGMLGEETAVSANTHLYAAKEMRFSTPDLHVKSGALVSMRLKNNDLYAHSFDIDELELHIPMDANGQTDIQFTAPAPGSYLVYCGVPGHREAGMVGTLVVEP